MVVLAKCCQCGGIESLNRLLHAGPGRHASSCQANTPAAAVVVAVVGLGTSGTQTLIYGLVANFYRTNVRSAGVGWCAGFGRLGGVGGPLLGGYFAGGGFALETIFYILASVAVLGSALTIVVPSSKNNRRLLPADA